LRYYYITKGRFGSTEERGWGGRDFNGEEVRENILIKNVFGLEQEGNDFKINLLFYP